MDTQRSLNNWLHFFAALILLLFSASHFTDLVVGDPSHRVDNTVFPFLKNKTLFLIAAIFEAVIGLMCMKWRGRDSANIVILFFITIMVWYRWAFSYTGGFNCGCAGVLRKVLHVSKTAENVIPVVALVYLFLVTTPWLYRLSQSVLRQFNKTALFLFLLWLPLTGKAVGADAVEITGEYSSAYYDQRTKQPIPNASLCAAFTAVLSGETFKISSTNLATGRWAQTIYDGANMHMLDLYAGLRSKPRAETNLVYATILSSPHFYRSSADKLHMFFPWLTYGFSPKLAVPNAKGTVEIPRPWMRCRVMPGAWGYKWLTTYSAENRFLESCEVIRDQSLDLDDELELQRPGLDAPQTVADRNFYLENLRTRKPIPDGFVAARYTCSEWFQTNGMSFPKTSELILYAHPEGTPSYKANLSVTRVTVRKAEEKIVQPIDAPMMVHDYRYRKIETQGRSDFTEYELAAGEPWKPDNDPELINQMAKNVSSGHKPIDLSKNLLVWVSLAIVLLIPIAAMLWVKRARKQQPEVKR